MNLSYKIKSNYQQKQVGFTLVELLITLAVLGILVALAAPSFRSTVKSNQMSATYNHLIQAIKQARNESIAKASNPDLRIVNVCALDVSNASAAQCDPNSSNADWDNGWSVGLSGSSSANVLAQNQIKRMELDYPSIEIRLFTQNAPHSPVKRISFNSQGRMIEPTGTVVLQVCDTDKQLRIGSEFVISSASMYKSSVVAANECQ